MRTLDEALDMYGFRFSGKTTDKQKEELNKFWDKAFAGKTASSAEEIAVLESFGTCDFVKKCRENLFQLFRAFVGNNSVLYAHTLDVLGQYFGSVRHYFVAYL